MTRLLLAIGLGLASLSVSCGGSPDQPALEQPSAEHNEADVAFAQRMIAHHRQTIEMSGMALSKPASPEVKSLASRIVSAQEPEIDKMTAWLEDWGQPVEPQHGGRGGHGMLSEAEMTQLRQASGPAFDRLFLEGMIHHHEGGVTMSQEELNKGQYPDAKELARQIIAGQQAEISEMRRLLEVRGG